LVKNDIKGVVTSLQVLKQGSVGFHIRLLIDKR
jgi:hypothetical protein